MMTQHIYSFWDLDLEEFSPIWCAKNKAAALRIVQATLAGAPDSMIAQHPDRFELIDLGILDVDNCSAPLTPAYKTLGLVSALIAAPEKDDK